jgi:hypothetical protein
MFNVASTLRTNDKFNITVKKKNFYKCLSLTKLISLIFSRYDEVFTADIPLVRLTNASLVRLTNAYLHNTLNSDNAYIADKYDADKSALR